MFFILYNKNYMKKLMMTCLLTVVCVLTTSAQTGVYDFKVKDDSGKEVSLSDYRGKVLKLKFPCI